jgi:hypothetical protein
MGVLGDVGPRSDEPAWLSLRGPVMFAWDGRIHERQADLRPSELVLVTGPLESGERLETLGAAALARHVNAHENTTFRFQSGARVTGRFRRAVRGESERLLHVELDAARLELPGRAPLELAEYTLVPLGEFVTAHAGAVDPAYHGETSFPDLRVPKPRGRSEREAALTRLYERVLVAPRRPAAVDELTAVHTELERDYPHEWLLRWNLLERLLKLPQGEPLARRVAGELEGLEMFYERREPIAMGLKFLASESARG